METIAFKSSWKHAALENLIKEIDPNQDLSRSAITTRAIKVAVTVEDWAPIRENLLRLKRVDGMTQIPVSMQAKIDEDLTPEVTFIRGRISEDLQEFLERLQTPYFMQLLWMNYLIYLQNKKMSVGKANEKFDLSGPEIVKRLVQILLLNRASDVAVIEKIKAAILEWQE